MSYNKSYRPENPKQWGFYYGHGGMTYGFSSNQGYIPLAAGGFSVTSNTDSPAFSGLATCKAIEIVAEVLGGQQVFLNCTTHMGPFMQGAPASRRFGSPLAVDGFSLEFQGSMSEEHQETFLI